MVKFLQTILFVLISALPVVVITLLYSVVAGLAMLLRLGNPLYHTLMRSWSRLLLFFLRLKIVPVGLDRLDPEQPYIFLANHASYLDIIAIGAILPKGGLFVYKEELAKVPIWGWSLRASPFIMISRADPRNAMRSIEKAATDIREKGESVVIFPEGGRTKDGRLSTFRRGGFLLAAKTGVPMIPLAIKGAHHRLPYGEWRVSPGKIEVEFGVPVETPADLDRASERMLQKRLPGELNSMLGPSQRIEEKQDGRVEE